MTHVFLVDRHNEKICDTKSKVESEDSIHTYTHNSSQNENRFATAGTGQNSIYCPNGVIPFWLLRKVDFTSHCNMTIIVY